LTTLAWRDIFSATIWEKNMQKRGVCTSICSVFLLASIPLFAHHGTNISYDHARPVTLTGTVTEFVWQNPHTQVYFDVKDAQGKIVHWAGEMNSPGVLSRQEGWTKRTLKAGDQITITVYPAKAGTLVGVVNKIVLSGKTILENRGGQQ
jgi:hypothetical protein